MAKLDVEVGKTYVTMMGDTVTIIMYLNETSRKPFVGNNGVLYTPHGRTSLFEEMGTDLDHEDLMLVTEGTDHSDRQTKWVNTSGYGLDEAVKDFDAAMSDNYSLAIEALAQKKPYQILGESKPDKGFVSEGLAERFGISKPNSVLNSITKDVLDTKDVSAFALFNTLRTWGEKTFGDGEAHALAKRAKKEIKELIEASKEGWTPKAVEAAADIVLILTRAPGLLDAMIKKMKVNLTRGWVLKGDGTGEHVKSSSGTTDNTHPRPEHHGFIRESISLIENCEDCPVSLDEATRSGGLHPSKEHYENIGISPYIGTCQRHLADRDDIGTTTSNFTSSGDSILADNKPFTYEWRKNNNPTLEQPSDPFIVNWAKGTKFSPRFNPSIPGIGINVPGFGERHTLDTDKEIFFYEQEYYIYSNFSSFVVTYNDIDYKASEYLYHIHKFQIDLATITSIDQFNPIARAIYDAKSAHDAFKIARKWNDYRRKDWDDVKDDIMYEIICLKSDQHPYVKKKLIQSKGRTLIENSPRDGYWGWGPDRKGQNKLGKLWMRRRDEVIAEEGEHV